MLALELYEDDLCNGCGLPTLVRQDPSNLFRVEHDVCPVCSQLAAAGRVQSDSDEQVVRAMGEKPPPMKPRPTDGRSTRLRRVEEVSQPSTVKPSQT